MPGRGPGLRKSPRKITRNGPEPGRGEGMFLEVGLSIWRGSTKSPDPKREGLRRPRRIDRPYLMKQTLPTSARLLRRCLRPLILPFPGESPGRTGARPDRA